MINTFASHGNGMEHDQYLSLNPQSVMRFETMMPNHSLDDLKRIIPKHCFQSSLAKSSYYLVRDLLVVGALATAATQIPSLPWLTVRVLAWTLYGYVQGLMFTGLWIIAHECGHGSFSKYQTLNNCIGWFLHSSLLVPYFSWQLSHQRHHMFNAHMDKDTAHVPPRVEDLRDHGNDHHHLSEDIPIWSALRLLGHQLFGFQLYFLFFFTAGKGASMKEAKKTWYNTSHFHPWGVAFRSSHWPKVVLSDVGMLMTFKMLSLGAAKSSWTMMISLYLIPYLWVNHWIVAITLLHHSHPDVPRYEADSWTYLDGALSTVDRDYGWIGKHLFHNIIDFHVIHHLFPKIPFYHAAEATAAISPLLGSRLIREKGSFHHDLWTTFRTLRSVKAEQSPAKRGVIRVWDRV